MYVDKSTLSLTLFDLVALRFPISSIIILYDEVCLTLQTNLNKYTALVVMRLCKDWTSRTPWNKDPTSPKMGYNLWEKFKHLGLSFVDLTWTAIRPINDAFMPLRWPYSETHVRSLLSAIRVLLVPTRSGDICSNYNNRKLLLLFASFEAEYLQPANHPIRGPTHLEQRLS